MTDEQIVQIAKNHFNIESNQDAFAIGFKACQSMSPRWVKWSDQVPQESSRLICRFIHTRILIYDAFEMVKHRPDSINNIEYLYEPPKTDNDGK